jgi:hypothetical protein
MKLRIADCISYFHSRDIERVVREMVVHSCTGQKPNLKDFLKLKFEGVRYVDEDGILIDGAQAGSEHESKSTRRGEPGSEGTPMDDCHSTQAMGLLPVDFFTDPSVLFSGPSRSGFTRIGDQDISGSQCLPYDLSRFFCGWGSETSAADCHDGAE